MPVNSFPTVDIDLTLESIEGIVCNPEDSNHQNISNVRASVSFAGSPRNMRVSSFTMCGRTGNLVVESGVLEVKKEMINGTRSLGVDFGNTNVDFSRNQSSLTTSSSTSTSLPHLRLDSSLKSLASASDRSISIEEANRESCIFPDGRICVESNLGIEVDAGGSADDSRLLMEESLEWERNDPGRPDVVDIFVSLHTEENEICAEGVAHLVLFGMQSESTAVTTLNLRLKEKNILNSSIPDGSVASANSRNSCFSFGANASIRVQLATITDHVESLSAGGSSSPQKVHVHIGNLEERMNQPDLLQIAKEQSAKTPNPSMAHGAIPEESSKGYFCTGIDLEESLYNVFGFNKKERRNVKKNIMPNMTFESTILTRESLLI